MSNRTPLRTVEIIAVGSELLGSGRVDTNSLFLSSKLLELGMELRAKAVVGDDRDMLATLFAQSLDRSDLVLFTGGLGPTDDDLTREAVASVLGLDLEEDPQIVARIEARFAKRGMRMPSVNRRQAMVPRGAVVLDNPNGTAPGLYIEAGARVVVLLPGPPREMRGIMEALCGGLLLGRAGRERAYTRSLFITGRTESHVEETAQPIYSPWTRRTTPIVTTILASPGQVELHLTVRSEDPVVAGRLLEQARAELVAALGPDVFSIDGRSLEALVGDLLREQGLSISVAESCTGGLLLSRLTDVPGSSDYVRGGLVAYSNDLKVSLAGVDEAMIAAEGAVSEPVAVALAEGARARTRSDLGIGITGIAGPGGGSAAKPVGTVAIALAGPGNAPRARTFWFVGGRTQVKFQATQAALDMVRRTLQKTPSVG